MIGGRALRLNPVDKQVRKLLDNFTLVKVVRIGIKLFGYRSGLHLSGCDQRH